MKKQITNTGELRAFLVNMMIGVKDGDIEIPKASQIGKLAAQITESFYSEIKIAQVQTSLGREAAELGALNLGDKGKDL